MIKRIAQTAGFTGLLAALLLTVLQSFWVAPLILAGGNLRKRPGRRREVHTHTDAWRMAAHSHDAEAWEPEDGWQRVLSTTGG
jgi:predicted cobalt transporter CbtA